MRRGFWRSLLLCGAIGVTVTLSACSLPVSGMPTASGPPSVEKPAEASSVPEDTFGPAAAVTIAGVDVDGRNVTVAGLVTGVSEAGGDCRFVLAAALTGAGVEAATTGKDNGSNTSCSASQVPVEQLSKGPWSVVLHYTSSTLSLVSTPVKLEIP